jgi:DNA-binding CsgD family transcriptional regulator
VERTVEGIMDTVLEMTGAQRGCVIRRNPRTGDLEIIAGKNTDKGAVSFDNISLTVIFDVLESGEAVLTRNVAEEAAVSRYHSIRKYGIHAVLCFPVSYMGTVIGVCYCDSQMPTVIVSKEGMEAIALLITQFLISFESASPSQKSRKVLINEGHLNSKCEELGLTKREKEVLVSTVKGFSNREICAHFGVSLNTLRTHLKNLYTKAGARDRDELIDIFARARPPVRDEAGAGT